MFKKILLLVLASLLVLTGIVFYKATTLSSLQMEVTPAKELEVPEGVFARLSRAIQIPTISYDDREQIDYTAFDSIQNYIQDQYPLVDSLLEKKVIAQYSLLYTWRGQNADEPPVAMLAHLDVVPVAEKEPEEQENIQAVGHSREVWKYPPFSGQITKDYIWGRGSLDDKMNVFGMLEAVEMLLETGFQPSRTIYLAFGHDEEIGGSEGAAQIARYLAEKNTRLACVLDEGLFILDGMMPGIQQPVAYIGVAEKGFVNIKLRVASSGGHSSRPPRETAIGILSKGIARLEDHRFSGSISGATEATLDYLSPEMDWGTRIIFANRWLLNPFLLYLMGQNTSTNATIRTTIAPTMLEGSPKANVLPTEAKAVINFRIKPGETVESVLAEVKAVLNDERIQAEAMSRGFDGNDPLPLSDLSSESFQTLHRTVKEIFPEVLVAPALMIAGTDSKHFQKLTQNIYRFSPIHLSQDELDGFHGINERISKENYRQVIRFYVQWMKNLNQK